MNQIERNLIWFFGGLAATAAIAWIAFQVQQEGFAPALLFPVIVGAALGAVLLLVRHFTGAPTRRGSILWAVVWGLLLVVAQDYIGHRYRVRMFEHELAESHPLAATMASDRDLHPTFAGHIKSRVGEQPVWWSLDLLLTAAAASAVTAIGTRRSADTHLAYHESSADLSADRQSNE